jgi:hypothetical protein
MLIGSKEGEKFYVLFDRSFAVGLQKLTPL